MEKHEFWGVFRRQNFRLTLFNVYIYELWSFLKHKSSFEIENIHLSKRKQWAEFQNLYSIYVLKYLCFNI